MYHRSCKTVIVRKVDINMRLLKVNLEIFFIKVTVSKQIFLKLQILDISYWEIDYKI